MNDDYSGFDEEPPRLDRQQPEEVPEHVLGPHPSEVIEGEVLASSNGADRISSAPDVAEAIASDHSFVPTSVNLADRELSEPKQSPYLNVLGDAYTSREIPSDEKSIEPRRFRTDWLDNVEPVQLDEGLFERAVDVLHSQHLLFLTCPWMICWTT